MKVINKMCNVKLLIDNQQSRIKYCGEGTYSLTGSATEKERLNNISLDMLYSYTSE